jgi:predicted nucleic acid-binding protein
VILLDTNVLIYASTPRSPFLGWAREVIAEEVSGDGAATSVVSIAEICVGDAEPDTVAERIRSWGVVVLDVPAAAAEPCARAFREYRERRKSASDRDLPPLPLPDFFIGAHAEIMGWPIATADEGRFRTYFPSVVLKTP